MVTAQKTSKSAPRKAAAKVSKPKKPTISKDKVESMEYEIVGKIATIKLANKTIKLKKWGLSKRVQLGARVSLILDQLSPYLEGDKVDPNLIIMLLGQLIDDVMYIIIESTEDTFPTFSDGIDWIDEFCGTEELFALGRVVYNMNLGDPESVGKLTTGLEGLVSEMGKLLK